MKKSNKKRILITFCLGALGFLIINPTTEQTPLHNTVKIKTKTPSRAPASIKPAEVKREVIGEAPAKIDQINISNKINDKWKKLYESNFLRMVKGHEVKDLNIELKRSLLQIKKGSGQNLEHIKVSYTRPDGKPFSFEALVDSETGRTVRTWNQTRYEFKKPVKLNATGRVYRE